MNGRAHATPERKCAPLSPAAAGFAAARGEGRGGVGPYVHTYTGTSQAQCFEGSTSQYFEKQRKKKRFHTVAEIYQSLWKIGEEERAKALIGCGNWFDAYKSPCGTVKLRPCHCDDLFCPECCNRRSIDLQKRIADRMNQTEHDYWHLIPTVASWADLSKPALKRFIRQLARLRETDVWKEQVTGGVYSVETTWNEGPGWHPHFHILIETPKKLPMDWITRLKAKWREITGSHYIRLERMYGLDKKQRKTRKINRRSIREIVKYTTKAASFAARPELVRQFIDAFKSVRRMQAFGSFLGAVKQAEKDTGEKSQPAGCACGKCPSEQFTLFRTGIHISETQLMLDGTRQLKPCKPQRDEPPPGDWLSEAEYKRIESRHQIAMFAGPLFDGACEQFG